MAQGWGTRQLVQRDMGRPVIRGLANSMQQNQVGVGEAGGLEFGARKQIAGGPLNPDLVTTPATPGVDTSQPTVQVPAAPPPAYQTTPTQQNVVDRTSPVVAQAPAPTHRAPTTQAQTQVTFGGPTGFGPGPAGGPVQVPAMTAPAVTAANFVVPAQFSQPSLASYALANGVDPSQIGAFLSMASSLGGTPAQQVAGWQQKLATPPTDAELAAWNQAFQGSAYHP